MTDNTNTITTTVTFAELISATDDDLGDHREAYEDAVALAREEFGEDALDRHVPEDADDEELQRLSDLQQQAEIHDASGKAIQTRQHVLERLKESYSSMEFTIKMLTGSELMDIETALRMRAHEKGVPVSTLQADKQQLTVDAAVVDAPPEVPRDDDGNPVPSECPNPLTLALFETVQTLNMAGATDFRAPGFGDSTGGAASGTSATPTRAGELSNTSDPDGPTTPDSGDSS